MAARPADYPKLGDSNALDFSTGKISSALRNNGYANGAKLPAAQFNELMNEINKWIQYMDGIDSGLNTRVGNLEGSQTASGIANDSSVAGTKVKDALNNLLAYAPVTETGSFTATFPTGKDMTLKYRKVVVGASDALITLYWPTRTGLDSASTFVASGTPVPSGLRPVLSSRYLLDLSTIFTDHGGLTLSSSGSLTFDTTSARTDIKAGCITYYKEG
jgi:hypothetical protein